MHDYWDSLTEYFLEYWAEFNTWLNSLTEAQIAFYPLIITSLFSLVGVIFWFLVRRKKARQDELNKQQTAKQAKQQRKQADKQHQEKLALKEKEAERQRKQHQEKLALEAKKIELHQKNIIDANAIKPAQPFPTIPKPDYFIGRDDLLEKLHQRLQQQQTLLLVNGLGGIGKTALAQTYFNQHQAHYHYCAWVFVDEDLQRSLIEQLHIALGLYFEPDQSIEIQFAQVITALQRYEGNNLLVLDNADHSNELIQYKAALQTTGWTVLITSRCTPDEYEAYLLPIEELSPDDATCLFHHYYPLEGDLQPLLKQIYYHTLLIELVAKAGKKKGLSLVQLQQALDVGIDAEALKRTIHVGSHADSQQRQKRTQLYGYLLAMFEPEKLPQTQLQYVINFAVLAADDIPLAHLYTLFAIGDKNQFEDDLEALYQAGWLTKKHNQAGTFYKMHALIQDSIRGKLDIQPKHCQGLIINLKKCLQKNLTKSIDYIPYAAALTKKLDKADIELALLNAYLSNIYRETGALRDALTKIQCATQYFETLDHKEHLAVSYEKLGSLEQSLGHLDKALAWFELYKTLIQKLSRANPHSEELKNGLAISYSKLGEIEQSLGHLDKALAWFELDLKITQELSRANPHSESLKNGLAISYSKLGSIEQSLGHLDKALAWFELRQALGEELSRANPHSEELKNGLAISYSKLAEVNQDKTQIQRYYQQAIALWDELYPLAQREIYQDYKNIVLKRLAALEKTE